MSLAADPALAAAADWAVRLQSPRADAQMQGAFARWLAADAAHRAAWDRLQAAERLLAAPLARIRAAEQQQPGQAASALQALAAGPSRRGRRAVLGGGAAAVAACAAAALVNRHTPLQTLAAQLRTATGERRTAVLPDGSELTLNARSAVDMHFAAGERVVLLRAGEILVQVADDPTGRPFAVQTAQGRVQAWGTRLLVRQEDGCTRATALAQGLHLVPRSGAAETLEEGMGAVFDATRVRVLAQVDATAQAAWTEGLLDARDLSLGEVVDALRPYHAGLLRVDPQAARLRIFGVFALDRPQRVLQDLVDTQPIRVRQWGSLVTLIEPRAA
ncbi:FecR family protein [Pseudorhodoferax sp. Leaf274]|uniref:FecR family protein n=1 Tax=Pseudorhodoferax sp. Leaf274 TaxID=1736318 RepID=UPI00070391E6|nr:FecR domain-containing protein [Pseudorhodoferax sp. Leaf274]KQP38951.1 hypothetical protein ASF44_10985 [Pseudorhodoferax sp. Leaf274]